MSINLIKHVSPEPVQTHGGYSRSVTWKLMLNGVVLQTENVRYPLKENVEEIVPPSELTELKRLLIEALPGLTGEPPKDEWTPPQDCDPDGNEIRAFEKFGHNAFMDMSLHPIHYLFMNPETAGARKGWKAALAYCREQYANRRKA